MLNVGVEMENDENIEESFEFVVVIEEKWDDIDYESYFNLIVNMDDDFVFEIVRLLNVYLVIVEVYSYKVNDDKMSKVDGDFMVKEVIEVMNLDVLLKSEDYRENINVVCNFVMVFDEKVD